jgi:1-acyl-sn-glycerol-3-phosphate acyltransferase
MSRARRALDVARSAAIWAGFAGVTLAAFPPMVLGYPLVLIDPNRALSDAWFRTLGRILVRINPMWKVEVEGRQQLEHGGPFVLIVNHQSLADLIVMCFLHHPAKYLGKESLFRIPVFGWALRIAGEVPVRRGDRDSGSRALAELARWLERGVSVCVFPEGTRSKDGRLGSFRLGAFNLAIDKQRPIVPIVLTGAYNLLPRDSFILERHADVRVRVLAPVPTTGLGRDDVQALADRVHEIMSQMLEQLESQRSND